MQGHENSNGFLELFYSMKIFYVWFNKNIVYIFYDFSFLFSSFFSNLKVWYIFLYITLYMTLNITLN